MLNIHEKIMFSLLFDWNFYDKNYLKEKITFFLKTYSQNHLSLDGFYISTFLVKTRYWFRKKVIDLEKKDAEEEIILTKFLLGKKSNFNSIVKNKTI